MSRKRGTPLSAAELAQRRLSSAAGVLARRRRLATEPGRASHALALFRWWERNRPPGY